MERDPISSSERTRGGNPTHPPIGADCKEARKVERGDQPRSVRAEAEVSEHYRPRHRRRMGPIEEDLAWPSCTRPPCAQVADRADGMLVFDLRAATAGLHRLDGERRPRIARDGELDGLRRASGEFAEVERRWIAAQDVRLRPARTEPRSAFRRKSLAPRSGFRPWAPARRGAFQIAPVSARSAALRAQLNCMRAVKAARLWTPSLR